MAMQKTSTIYDIAKKMGISPATVSRGLQNNEAVKKETRNKIFSVARELGYRTNTFAKSLRTGKTRTIGVIVPTLNSNFMSAVLAGMETAAANEKYNLIVSQSMESFEKQKVCVHAMMDRQVDGLLISLASDSPDIEHLRTLFANTPVVFFDRAENTDDYTNILIDNFKSARKLTQHLIEQGCTRLMHIGGNKMRKVYADRLEGFKQALKDNNLPYNPDWMMDCDLSENAGIKAAEFILNMKDKPDGVIVANDHCAVHCMLYLQKKGIKIPQDIAFAGFNNDAVCKVVQPNLTTVDYPGHTLGETTIQMLLKHISGGILANTNTILLRAPVIVRASSLRKGQA